MVFAGRPPPLFLQNINVAPFLVGDRDPRDSEDRCRGTLVGDLAYKR